MSDSFIGAMDVEIETLEASLSKNPQYVKLKELQRLRHLWTTSDVRREPTPRMRASKGGRRSSPQRQRIIEEVVSIIRETFSASPVSTVSLVRALQAKGVPVPGKDPRNSLSAILSGTKQQFQSHGRAGWTISDARDAMSKNTEAAGDLEEDAPAASADARPTSERNPW